MEYAEPTQCLERTPSELDKRIMENKEVNYVHQENMSRLARIVTKLTGPVPENNPDGNKMSEPNGALEAMDMVINESRIYGANTSDLINRLEQLI